MMCWKPKSTNVPTFSNHMVLDPPYGRWPENGAQAGGEGGIRTHGGVSPTTVFKTVALNHSATSPAGTIYSRLGVKKNGLCAPRRRRGSQGRETVQFPAKRAPRGRR